jgi:N-acyl-D-amino-acid deacylase
MEGGKISTVLREGEDLPEADTNIDVKGRVISPGFIDMHSHSDWILPLDDHPGLLKCLPEQGITTIVAGNCGFSPAPAEMKGIQEIIEAMRPLIYRPLEVKWGSMGEFLDNVEETGPIVNLAQLVGHATLRNATVGRRRGAMTPRELLRCIEDLSSSLDEGACGLSFGLGYDPGLYSPTEEIEEFCLGAARKGKPVTVHLKALSKVSPAYPINYFRPHNIRAIREMIEIARKTGVSIQISHFVFVGRKSWSTAEECIMMVESARKEGIDVMIDAFPYTFGNSTINVIFPYWFIAGMPQVYKNPLARLRLRLELKLGLRLLGLTFGDFQVMDVAVNGWEDLDGMTLVEIAEMWKTGSFDALLRLSESSNGGTLLLLHGYSGESGKEGLLERVLAHDLCLFETDAVIKGAGYPNSAGIGAFPKILGHYVRDRNLFTLEDAIRRMTSASADRFGLKDRGILSPKKAADVVVFNPEIISETPPLGKKPAGSPRGIEYVFINGVQVVSEGSYINGNRAGQVLRL